MLLVRFIDNNELVLYLIFVLEIIQELTSEMNKLKRKIFHEFALLTGITEVVLQATSHNRIFEVGSLHLTHGKITILPVDRDTQERQRGLSEAAPSRNGNRLDQVRFYGFMENVSPARVMLLQCLIVSIVFPP